ncbi:transglutaminase family protein [Telmatospirillum sp.]|uniref:transglutaminase family protein n=1 Tax=Telmatospirillum sp. TaxID=2079197 RepID=UPI0028472B6D|nr:transglutaminase family protein [Telmatospirillum sp.]MDR3440079.1 transglutaminase family protein [Telmatospirillum sp.]
MIYKVRHLTTYAYNEPVLVAHHMAHLVPRTLAWQTCRRSALRIRPQPTGLEKEGIDYFGNSVCFFTLHDPHKTLAVEAISRVELTGRPLPNPQDTPSWESVIETLNRDLAPDVLEATEFRFDSPFIAASPALAAYAAPSFPADQPLLAGLLDLMHRIHSDFTYDATATTVATPLARVLADRRGVCQDFAHLGIACLRSMGLAARYVSGYLLTHPAPGKVKLKGSDASHAWFSAFVPGHGWIDVDPTNDKIPDLEHVTTAWGRDYDDVSPLKGVVLGGGEQSLRVAVDVEPIDG